MSPALLLCLLTAIRLVVAATAPLAPDEAYYWVWSRALQPGYLDHPPMVALWIRLGTALGGETVLGVRLLAPLAAALGSVLLADAAERLYPGRRLGIPAAALLNATLMVGAGAVTMTPDTPLLFFAVLTLWALSRIGADGRWWLLVGAAAGCGLDSKYTGAFLGLSIPLWLLWSGQARQFRAPWIWVGGAIAAGLFLPVVAWNAAHGWASFAKQGGRTGDWQPVRAAQFLGELVAGQAGLATPPIFVLFAAGLWRALARRDRAGTLLVALALPGLLVFGEHALGDRVQANWLAVLYPPLAIAAAAVEARWWRAACSFGLAVTALVYVQAVAAPFGLARAVDPTLRLAGWDALARQADAMRVQAGVQFLASADYSDAAELAWWAPKGTMVVGAEARWTLFTLPKPVADDGLLLLSDRRREGPDPAVWTEASEIGHLTRARAGVEAEGFRVYRVRKRDGAPAAMLPRPGGE
jgi:4-amino-4-deoxy-L-arabinose transferase-like glycosyltransferase